MEIIGYKYLIEQDAQNAVNQCNSYYGIPVLPTDVTQNWCEYNIASLDTPIFWYIIHNNTLDIVLGQPITFEITTPPPLG